MSLGESLLNQKSDVIRFQKKLNDMQKDINKHATRIETAQEGLADKRNLFNVLQSFDKVEQFLEWEAKQQA